MSTPNIFKRLLRDTRGASLIEFAFIAPAFFAILVAIMQTGMVYLAQGGLETAADTASRLLMTGQAQDGGMTADQYRTQVCQALPPYLKCSDLYVDVTTASNFAGANLGPPTMTYNASTGAVTNSFAYNTGTQGAIVVVRLMYLWPVIPAPFGFNLANQPKSKRLLMATAVLKTEYY